MLIHPWDAGTEPDWRALLASHDFGQLIAAGRGRDVPVVVPTHFVHDGELGVLLHLARPNPVWAAIDENPTVLLTVIADYAYVPTAWKAIGDEDPALGVPTSYYATAQLTCAATVVDDPEEKLAILRTQLGHFEPAGGWADPAVHARLLPGIRGLRLAITDVRCKLKYGGNVDEPHRQSVAARLRERGGQHDAAAAARVDAVRPVGLGRAGGGPTGAS